MRQRILSIVAVALLNGLVIPRPLVWGFEIVTHAEISDAAADQSDLQAPLATLGLNALDDPVVFLPATGAVHSARKWLQLGSEYEDDLSSLRFRNHFYNPLNGSGLAFSPAFPCSIGGIQSGKPAPNWGLDEGGVNQEYSLKDARDAYYKGLTAPFKDFRDPRQPPEDTRSHHLARMFETLGHVIHLIQDMAQPQHTRNDPHGPGCFGTGSFYEGYTKDIPSTELPLTGYQPVYGSTDTTTFNAPQKFWHGEGKGLAEYTNRGFVTTGTNFDTFSSGKFPEPDPNLATSHDEDMSTLCETIGLSTPPGPNGPLPCIMRFVKTRVTDAYRPGTAAEEENARASTYSIFSADLKTYNEQVAYTDPTTGQVFMTPVLYTLNSLNFDARNEFVIKRAVGYSAGFINYFFRGKIDLVPDTDPANPGGFLIKNLGTEDMDGTFTLYYDDKNDMRQGVIRDAGGTAIGWPLAIPAGGEVQVPSFDIPTDPAPKTPGEYMLVFTGTLGEEVPVNGSMGAVVAKRVKPASPFLLVKDGAVYRSQFLDQGWQQVGGESGLFSPAGYFINENLLFGADFAQKSIDGGRTFTYLEDETTLRHYWLTYLGGTQLLSFGCTRANFGCSGPVGFLFSPDLGTSWTFTQLDEEIFHYGVFDAGPWYAGKGIVFGAGRKPPLGSRALFKSTDNGVTWTFHTTLDFAQWEVWNMWWNQVEGPGSVLLANGWSIKPDFTRACGIWKSEDGGITWRRLTTATEVDNCSAGVGSLAIDPHGNALMSVSRSSSLYRSTDAGESWEPAKNPDSAPTNGVIYLGNPLAGD